MSSGEIKNPAQARSVLDLGADADLAAVRAAFQRAAKAHHPDRGGDADRFRRVLEAYRLLQGLAEARGRLHPQPDAAPPPSGAHHPYAASAAPTREPRTPLLKITIAEAFLGGPKSIRLADGREGQVKLPPGLRSGEVLRFEANGEQRMTIAIAIEADAQVRGDDLWLDIGVSPRFLQHGGRLEVNTPFGKRRLWVSRTSAARGLFRVPGGGLPARESRPRGALYLRFALDPAQAEPPSRSLRRKFASVWAA